jgi:hypothetical protein
MLGITSKVMYEECIADCARDEVTRMFKPVNFTKT